MSLKLRTRCRWCQSQFRGWDVLKTVEMAIWHKKADDMNGIRESFLSLNLFSLSFKIYFMALLRWAIAPIAPPPWIRHWVGFQSEQVVYMLTTSCCQVYSRLRLCGSYVLPTNEQKQSAKSFSFGYFSSKTNRQNCSLSRCLFPRTKLWACVSQFPLLWQWLLLKRQHQTVVSTSISETNRKVSK